MGRNQDDGDGGPVQDLHRHAAEPQADESTRASGAEDEQVGVMLGRDVEETVGIQIMRDMTAQLPGYLIPKLVREMPGEAAKSGIPLTVQVSGSG